MANVSSSNSQKELVPRLRFPGFTNAWERHRFADVFSILPNNTLSRDNLSTEGAVKNIHYGDVLIKFGDVLNSSDHRIPFIKDVALLGNKVQYLRSGDIIIADTAEDDTVGKACELSISTPDKVVSGLHTIACRPRQGFAPGFLGYYINSPLYHKQLYPYMQGVKVTSISKGNIANTLIDYPDYDEQQQISCILGLVDQRIDRQCRLIDALKSYKRGVIKSLLDPQNQTTNDPKWVTSKIGDLGEFIKGAPLSKADISSVGKPLILYGELYTTYGEVVYSVVRKTESATDECYLSRVGDVVIPTSGETPEDIATASCIMVPGVVLAGDLAIFRSDKIDGRILSYILTHIVNDQIARIAQGKSIVHIQASEINRIQISYPNSEEQSRIASVLGALDRKIQLCALAIERARDVRKGLLQDLFI